MPKFRVEIESQGGWRMLHGSVEARSADEAVAYVRAVLPIRCEGQELRAVPVKTSAMVHECAA